MADGNLQRKVKRVRPDYSRFDGFLQPQRDFAFPGGSRFGAYDFPEAVTHKTVRRPAFPFGVRPEPGPADRRTALDRLARLIIGALAEKHQVVGLVGGLIRQYLTGINGDYGAGLGVIDPDIGESAGSFNN